MPPRYAYWTILAGGLPTAFRAADREELLPTFKRLRERHPDAELKYFARGRLWSSRDEADAARAAGKQTPSRGRDWRPGGDHRDPRQQFKQEQKARNQARRQERWTRRHGDAGPAGGPASQRPQGKPRTPPRTATSRTTRPPQRPPSHGRVGTPAAPRGRRRR